jgi:glucosamine-phosphate N-acetyltransferase
MEIKYISLVDFISSKLFLLEKVKKAYLELLSMLTNAPEITNLVFINKTYEIAKMGVVYIGYYYDIETQELFIVGSGTVVFEPKFIHGGKYVGHIEDIVVHEKFRGVGIAKTIADHLINLAKEKKCYKVILDCKPEIENLYSKLGFEKRGSQMAMYFCH